jgi:hypothetical protein
LIISSKVVFEPSNHVLLLADVETLPNHPGAFRRSKVDAARQRRVNWQIVLQARDERQHIRALACGLQLLLRVLDHLAQRVVVELARRRGSRAVPVIDRQRQASFELHHVGGDVRVGEARRRAFATVEIDLGGLRLGHVQHPVRERLDFVA